MGQIIKDNSDKARVRKSFIKQAVFAASFTLLTGGVFLSGLAIYMGASDVLVSYISMITNICGISILFFSSVIERFHSFKRITIGLTILSKLTTLLIVLIPLFVPGKLQIIIFVPLMVIAFTLQAQTTVVLENWMVTFVDEKKSGRYIARRQTFVLAISVILPLAGGRLLDSMSGAYIGFAILFLAALVMAVIEVVVLFHIPDAVQKTSKQAKQKHSFSDMLCLPMRCKPFLGFVIYIFVFYLMLSISDSFTVVYMMRYLELPYSTINIMQMILSLPQIFLLGVWGKISDKKGHKFALSASIWFFVGEVLFLALSDLQNYYVFIPIAFLFAAIGNSGFVVSVFNRRYELMPQEGRILYSNFYAAAVGLAFILGPLTGGLIKQLLETSIPTAIAADVQFLGIRLLYGFSTIAIITIQIIFTVRSTIRKKALDN